MVRQARDKCIIFLREEVLYRTRILNRLISRNRELSIFNEGGLGSIGFPEGKESFKSSA